MNETITADAINIDETPFNNQYKELERTKRIFDIGKARGSQIIACTLWAIGTYLSALENKKNEAHGVYFSQLEAPETKVFAGILEFDKNEDDEENAGAFEFTTTYDPETMARASIPCTDARFLDVLQTTLLTMGGMNISDVSARRNICTDALDFLKQFIENQVQANPSAVVALEYDGIYLACGGVEDDKIIVTIIPGADIKHKCIKDDANSEKA